MKKEIEVFISDYFERNGFGNIQTIHQGSFNNSTKATLVIEMPEKKIEITESELRECFDTFQRLEEDHDRRLVYSFYEYSRRKLFGER